MAIFPQNVIPAPPHPTPVIPAQAGTHSALVSGELSGTTVQLTMSRSWNLRELLRSTAAYRERVMGKSVVPHSSSRPMPAWIPTCAGMTLVGGDGEVLNAHGVAH